MTETAYSIPDMAAELRERERGWDRGFRRFLVTGSVPQHRFLGKFPRSF